MFTQLSKHKKKWIPASSESPLSRDFGSLQDFYRNCRCVQDITEKSTDASFECRWCIRTSKRRRYCKGIRQFVSRFGKRRFLESGDPHVAGYQRSHSLQKFAGSRF